MARRNALPSQTGRPPVSARGTRTRDALVAAARRVFERDGFLEARITDIATEAGVAAGSFYTYFTSKDDAFAAVIDELSEEMLHPGPTANPTAPEDPIAVIEATNRAYLLAYRRNAKLMALMEQVAQVDDDFRRLRLKRARAFIDRNARAIARLQRRGLADPGLDPSLAAQAMSSMVSRMAYNRYVLGIGDGSLDAIANTLTRLWANALGITSHPTRTRS